jgi:hypothetical protein
MISTESRFSTDRIVESIAAELRARYGEQGDVSDVAACHPSVLRAYRSGVRVRVVTTYDNGEIFTRTGTVSRTTGWRPALLLVHRSNAISSWDVLGPRDVVTHVRIGRRYVETINAK